VATPNPLPHHYLFPGSGRHCPRTPHPTPRMRAGFGFHNEVKEFSFSVQKTVTIESIYKAEICLLKNFFLEWTYPQPGSSHTFCCFCCCFCSGNSAQHHGKSCWCHLTSCLPREIAICIRMELFQVIVRINQ
jgi:hypothetical protein